MEEVGNKSGWGPLTSNVDGLGFWNGGAQFQCRVLVQMEVLNPEGGSRFK
jgi:hypothetical protein